MSRVRAARRLTEVEVGVRKFTKSEPEVERGGEQQAFVGHVTVVVEGAPEPVGAAWY
ncbi:MAG: hypothetical protein OXG65_16895 [Chloroflexi bacterium]|nr:hypothetical protein [Chloroflexota bacterium]